jgi:uncharacterized protein involved in outer membrane biogenesis
MKTLFRWLFRTLFFVVLLVILLVVSVTLLKIPIDLTIFKGPVETLVSKALKRPVNIDQSIVISTSLNPVFTLRGLRIGNPDGFSQETFINLDLAQIGVELLPLFQKKISIREISVRKLQLTLEEQKSGAVNWIIATDKEPDENDSAKKEVAKTAAKTGSIDWAVDTFDEVADTVREALNSIDWTVNTITVKKLMLQDIALYYYGPDELGPFRYQIAECSGSMGGGKPLKLDIAGNLLSFPYSLKINVASLKELLTENSSWMDIQMDIAKTNLRFSGNINLEEAHRSLALKANVSGENLASLNDMFDLDLPPFSPYAIEADLLTKKDHWEIKNLMVQAGSSSLKGTARVIKGEEKTETVITFASPLIQLNDFIFEDWDWSEDEETLAAEPSDDAWESPEPAVEKDAQSGGDNRKILDPDVLNEFDIALNVHSEEILLGEETLGSGSLVATIRDGRIAIEPLKLNVPGGSVELSASVKPGTEKSDASFRAVMSNFDIGIMARRNQPESMMGGLVNLDVDLQSSAASVDQILANGNGYFDFSGNLENLRAGIVDLWAVNLIAAIVSSSDENESNINCAVGRWQVNDGSLTPDVFFIDTSKIRICGKGQVDFSTNQIDMTISPTPKKPEFFNLATPLRVRGSFSDIRLGVKKGGTIGTAVKFITSPIHVPIRRVVTKKIPKDGRDACKVVLGPDNRSESSVKGCK